MAMTRMVWRVWLGFVAALAVAASASAGVVLKLGDILVVEPGGAAISVIDPTTGEMTRISSGGFLTPEWMTVGVALARDGDVIVVHRLAGLIRVNPVTGSQSILSQGGLFRDPWTIAIDKNTGFIYVADSGYDNSRPVNEAGKIIRVDPTTGAQELIASGSPCTIFPANAACQNTTSAGSYLAHPYGIAIDYTGVPGTLVVSDMGSFNGNGAIVRINPSGGAQTLLWGSASAVPAPVVAQVAPFGCPMGVAVEPDGNILATSFTFPVPATPTFPAPAGTFYGCAPPGIYRIDLVNHVQRVVNANAPPWQPNRAYSLGEVVRAGTPSGVHRVTAAGVSQATPPAWNSATDGQTVDGSVLWQRIGPAASWLIPFGLDIEPAPTPANPSAYNIIVPDEGLSVVLRLSANGEFAASALISADARNVTMIDVIAFTPPGGFKVEPVPSNGQPSDMLPSNTTAVTLSLETNVDATCRYDLQPGTPYGSMPFPFANTGSTAHSTPVSGLSSGGSYQFYVRCVSSTGDTNSSDYLISFSVAEVPPPPFQEPIAAYNFDEGAGPILTDQSGHSNHGTLSGAAWTAQGRNLGALQFDGVNDWVTVASSSTLNVSNGMTLEAWVYPTANAGTSWRNVLLKERASGEVYSLYTKTSTNRPSAFVVKASQPGSAFEARGTSQLPLNTWSHLAATFDGTTLRLYVNGSQVGSKAVGGPLLTSTGPLRIGGNSLWGEFFQGRIDDLRIYNRPLSASAIVADMSTPVAGSPIDVIAPFRFNGQPSGTLAWGTTQTVVSLSTSENATCRYSLVANVAYSSMTNTFTTTGGTQHSYQLTGLTNGSTQTHYVRCTDSAGNANSDDFPIVFSVAATSTSASTFVGSESPLSENGLWDTPRNWASLHKNNGAYASAPNAVARLTAPIGPDQYAEIVYDQDPGILSWAGVMTRIQGANNGSGYLAIAYAGGVRLYRADDTGGLSFSLLAVAAANIGISPRRLRLESEVDVHRVYLNGALLINHVATGTAYWSGQPGIAASVFGGPQVKILSFEGGLLATGDHPPVRSNAQPSGVLPWGTTATTMSLTTNENATCRYSQQAAAYEAMTNTFSTTGGTAHSQPVGGLTNGSSHTYYVRCSDVAGNVNTDDFVLSFSVSSTSSTTSSFSGVESPLFENGMWDSPGSWSDLQKNNGAYATGLNAAGQLVSPNVGPDQYSEIVYDQDPGASSWAGVMTRVQGAGNGSGYLAIVYSGQVRLYRTDDSGGLNFTLLAFAAADLTTAPRRLRLESVGNTHRVYFNGTLLVSHNATNYTAGQPGIAASVFGGAQIKILSFEGGNVAVP